jgi:hypothetical protein
MDFQRLGSLRFGQIERNLPLLFVARMLVLYWIWLAGKTSILLPFLPFWPPLDHLKSISEYYFIFNAVYWIALFFILIDFHYKKFSIVVSLLIFFQIASSVSAYSTSFLFLGCLFLLIGMYKPGLEWIFRIQIGLLYFGAGLNKLLDPDWQSGQYFINFIDQVYSNSLNSWLVDWLGLDFLAKCLSVLTVVIELSLAFWTFSGKKSLQLVICILIFHLSFLVFTMGELSFVYFFLMASGGYLLLPWSKKEEFFNPVTRNNIFWKSQENIDFDNSNINLASKRSQIEKGRKGLRVNFGSIRYFIFYKVFYFIFVFSIVFISKYKSQLSHLFYGN